jgi:hypothetical protein
LCSKRDLWSTEEGFGLVTTEDFCSISVMYLGNALYDVVICKVNDILITPQRQVGFSVWDHHN